MAVCATGDQKGEGWEELTPILANHEPGCAVSREDLFLWSPMEKGGERISPWVVVAELGSLPQTYCMAR